MPNFFIFFIIITIISIFFSGLVIWNIVRLWSYRYFYKTIQPRRKLIKSIFFGIHFLIPVIAIISQILVYNYYSRITSIISTLSLWSLGALGYLLLGSIITWSIAWTLYCIRVISGKKHFTWNRFFIPFSLHTRTSIRIIITLPIIFSLGIIIYGTITTQSIRVVEYRINNTSLVTPFPDEWVGGKIVLVSDTHTGQIRKQKILGKMVSIINKQQPLITIIAGDLIDGPKFPITYLEPLTQFSSSFGNYFVPGNHEKYSRDSAIESIIGNYINLIIDNVFLINGVAIVGIDYHQSNPIKTFESIQKTTASVPENTPIIGVMHDPKLIPLLIEKQPNLTLSGHTHRGQMWPGNILVHYLYNEFAYGLTRHNNGKTVHITTSGIGTALVPMRVGSIPEVVVIHIDQ